MTFSIFNIQSMIRDENKKLKKNTKIRTDEYFGFESLSEKALQTLTNANNQLLQASQLFSGLSGKDQNEFKNDFISAIQQLDVKKFKEQTALYRQDIQKQKNQKWYDHQQKSLSTPVFWNKIIKNFASAIHSRILQLQKKWQNQKDYSHYNSLALKHVAENILPLFERYIELAYLELDDKGARLPLHISKAFKQYLVQLHDEINSERQKICWAMLGRLEVASNKGDLNYDDITIELTSDLKKMGVIKSDAQFPKASRMLTSSCFEFFHHYIANYGKQQLKNGIKNLAWFRENEQFTNIQTSNQILIVPKILQTYVPDKPSRFSLWFGGVKLRYQFLGDHLGLISRLRFLDKQPLVVNSLGDITNNVAFKTLNELGQELSAEYNSRKRFKSNLIQRIFQKKTLIFYEKWYQFLHAECGRVLEKKVAFLHLVSEQIKTRLNFEIDEKLLQSPDFKQLVKSLIENIESQAEELSIDVSKLNNYEESKIIILKVLNNDPIVQSNILHEILEEEALIICPNLRQSKNVVNDENGVQYFEKFLLNFNPDASFLEDDQSSLVKLEECSKFIQEDQATDLKSLYKKALEKSFLIFLQECVKWTEEESEPRWNKFRILQDLLSTQSPKHIRNRMVTLNELASKEQWYLWQVKCQSYLTAFDVDFIITDNSSLANNRLERSSDKVLSYNSSVRFFNHQINIQEISNGSSLTFLSSNCQL